jgi:uncharacterized membrane protein YphA (DoxX/SURF4 family)
MSLSAKLRRAPARAVTGAYILNAGLGKYRADEETAKGTHAMATNAFPVFEKLEPKVFTKLLAAGEITLGAALLLPVVPAAVAGAGLMAFSGGLLGMYWRTPHLHREHDPRPTQDGVAIAKDVWLFGIGTGLVVDAATAPVHTKRVQVTQHMKDSAEVNAAKAAAVTGRARSRLSAARHEATGRTHGATWAARKTAKAGVATAKAGAETAKAASAAAKDVGGAVKTAAEAAAQALPIG